MPIWIVASSLDGSSVSSIEAFAPGDPSSARLERSSTSADEGDLRRREVSVQDDETENEQYLGRVGTHTDKSSSIPPV
jgi:hypothetical protein